ncbi:MAG: hypothetical protein EZS28_049527 [Streblomastix strix]|uniref:Uncharacterized protein n=1 Tax=Streblomastix strix TaxID=222440 RepID=A0A5J4T926_9EUKA|nr:MAG: hypothetical protein EZS28_049527 [Streblomastix strix]
MVSLRDPLNADAIRGSKIKKMKKKKKKKKKKQKKKEKKIFGLSIHDEALTELHGANRSDINSRNNDQSYYTQQVTGNLLVLAIAIPHFLAFVSFVIYIFLYNELVGQFSVQILEMGRVCMMAGVLSRSGGIMINKLDDQAPTLLDVQQLVEEHAIVGQMINDVVSTIYEATSHLGTMFNINIFSMCAHRIEFK